MPSFDDNPAYDEAIDLMESDPETALERFAAASDAQPQRARIHANRTLVLLELGRTEEAQNAAQKAWALDAQDGYVGSRLVHALMDNGSHDEVAEIAETVLKLELDDDDAKFVSNARGWSLMRSSPSAAVTHAEQVAPRWPDDPEVAVMHACALAAACRWDDALREVDRAIEVDPNDARYTERRDSIAQMRGLGLDQIATHQAQAERTPDDADAWRRLGLVLARYARGPEALAALERARVLDPVDTDADTDDGSDLEPLVLNALMVEATLGPQVALGLPVDPLG